MVDADHMASWHQTSDLLYCQAWPESDLQHVVARLKVQQLDGPAIALNVGRPVRLIQPTTRPGSPVGRWN